MSGAESEGDDLQTVEMPFINPEITARWRMLDPHVKQSKVVPVTRRKGNRPRTLIGGSRSAKVPRKAPKGWPGNWYNRDWLKTLTYSERFALNMQPDRPIPVFVSSNSVFVVEHNPHHGLFSIFTK